MSPLHLQAAFFYLNSAHWLHTTCDVTNKANSNLFYDVTVQLSSDELKVVRVMNQKGEGSNCKRQLFVDRLHNQQPVKLMSLMSVWEDQINAIQDGKL